ncbi:small-conductance mechanosensitive channel [Kordia sp. SMS9]|uniref:mechanosensitive ion channel family protein n=1 Tax=Kordia sp. SMS9 TaxID=2282170 RepID=UPI000E0D2910|nr:mechanosensitive ion channel family protein [Kordia sp. SMS9]AXG72050.1 small-conductance mechanosensitive channel [Kordia sp. SMS9]
MEEQLQSSWSKLLDKLSGWVDSVVLNLPNLLIALLIFIFASWISRNLQSLTNRYLRKLIKQPSIRGLVSNVFSIVIIVLGLILALSVLNLDGTLKSLLAGAGVAGLAVSLALQGTLSNTFSGLFIAIKDEMNIGDWVETNGFSGKVVEIDLRNTKIKEADNNIVVVPNRMIMENPFKNYGLTKRIRTTITCGVGYESDLRKVKKVSIEAIEKLYPPNRGENIEFYYTDFGNSSIDFLLRFWVDAQENLTALEVKSEAVMTIKETFDKHGINIPFPIRTVIQQNTNQGSKEDSEQ